jgi:hypothetical protein
MARLPAGMSRATPIAEDIAAHLAPFDTAECLSPTTREKDAVSAQKLG